MNAIAKLKQCGMSLWECFELQLFWIFQQISLSKKYALQILCIIQRITLINHLWHCFSYFSKSWNEILEPATGILFFFALRIFPNSKLILKLFDMHCNDLLDFLSQHRIFAVGYIICITAKQFDHRECLCKLLNMYNVQQKRLCSKQI